MTLCPIALAVGCISCPMVTICPLKRVIGDIADVAHAKPKPKPVVAGKDRR